MAILEIRDVVYRYESKYQTTEALRGVRCAFEEGKFYALIGKSGSGKSTLLSLMAGLMLPTEGEILYRGTSTSQMDLDRYRRENVAVVYQSFRLFPLLTVEENVTYPMELRGVPGKEARETAQRLIRRVDLPDTVLRRFPGMLSGGEQQRVAVARAISMDSKLLLADEPTGNLDTENSDRVVELLLSLAHSDGYCVIVVTHDLEIAGRADCVYKMRDGKLSGMQEKG
ncbi:MAG: ABC transporter ATP-binding protein [Lachnospiraceae bacterium]|nr:ABC transporter ATP-binding protein [Lachnospiraceae bacterium]